MRGRGGLSFKGGARASHAHTHIRTHAHTPTYVHAHTATYVCAHAHALTRIHARAHTRMHAHTLSSLSFSSPLLSLSLNLSLSLSPPLPTPPPAPTLKEPTQSPAETVLLQPGVWPRGVTRVQFQSVLSSVRTTRAEASVRASCFQSAPLPTREHLLAHGFLSCSPHWVRRHCPCELSVPSPLPNRAPFPHGDAPVRAHAHVMCPACRQVTASRLKTGVMLPRH